MKNRLNLYIFLLFAVVLLSCGAGKNGYEPAGFYLVPKLADTPESGEFRIKANGSEAAVEKIGKFDIPIHYTQMVYNGNSPLQIEVEVDEPVRSYSISPVRKSIKGVTDRNKLVFTVTEPGYLVVKINNLEDLFILVNPPVDYVGMVAGKEIVNIMEYGADPTGNRLETVTLQRAIDEVAEKRGVLYFPAGIYKTGGLNLKSNLTIWLADDALVMGSNRLADYTGESLIRMDGVSNLKLLGNGTIDGAGWAGLRRDGAGDFHLVYASECRDILFDGIVLRDPVFWNTRVYRSENFHLRNIKVLNNRPYKNWTNTDGIDFDSSVNCSLIHSVIHAGDDNVVVKGLDGERKWVTRDILFEDVLTLSNSAAAKIGTETCVESFSNIVFRDIDVIKCKRAMVINGFDSAHIRNVLFENFTIENFDYNGREAPRLIDIQITDRSWRECTGDCVIEEVILQGIDIRCGMRGVESLILGKDSEYSVNGIVLKNFTLQGNRIRSGEEINLLVNDFVNDLSIE